MQVTSQLHSFKTLQNDSLQDINQNLNLRDRQILRKALMQIPSKDLPKVLKEIKKIPVDENYLKNILQTINQKEINKKEGFEIYA
jgi:vacuolar-type H+-ATPase subunit E/Vma4